MAQDHKTLLGTKIDQATRTMFTHLLAQLVRSLRDDDLTLAQVAALHLLQLEGTLRVLELAERLELSASAASRMIDALAERGLVHREEDPADRRARVLSLTAKGQELAGRMNEERLKVFARHMPFRPNKIADRILGSLLKVKP